MTIINILKRVQVLRQKFTHSLGLLFQELLPKSIIQEALNAEKIDYRKRLYYTWQSIDFLNKSKLMVSDRTS